MKFCYQFIFLIIIFPLIFGCLKPKSNDKIKNNKSGIISGMNDPVPDKEQEYIDNILSQITKDTTKNELIELLGEPSRDLGFKINWWIEIEEKKSRVGVFIKNNQIKQVVLDGGPGRFYYSKDIE